MSGESNRNKRNKVQNTNRYRKQGLAEEDHKGNKGDRMTQKKNMFSEDKKSSFANLIYSVTVSHSIWDVMTNSC